MRSVGRRTLPRPLPGLLLTAALALALALPATAGAKLPSGPTPQFADCLYWRGPGMCLWGASYISFSLSRHVLHVGDTITGKYGWGPFPYDSYSATFQTGGNGLGKRKCSSLKGMKTGGKDATGSMTCRWKATRPTGTWQIGPQITLHGNAGAGSWPEQDYYIVLGKEKVITGRVVRKGSGKQPGSQPAGVANVTVKIHGPQSKSVRTNADGYYTTEVKKSGRYRVTPQMTKKLGRASGVKPRSKVVVVSAKKVGEANFQIEDNLTIDGKVDTNSVPGDGRGVVNLTLTATRFGEPVPNVTVAVMPNGESVGSDPDTLPVPARYCTDNRVDKDHWPSVTRGGASFEAPLDVRTDDKGTAQVRVQVGTVPGGLRIGWWARGEDGKLDTGNILTVKGETTVNVTPTPTFGGFFDGLRQALQAGGPSLPDDPGGLIRTLRSDPNYALGVSYTYVNAYVGNVGGVLVAPQNSRHTINTDKTIVPSPDSFIIPPSLLSPAVRLASGSFSGAIAAGAIGSGLSPADFLAGKATQLWKGWQPAPDTKLYFADDGWIGAGYPYEKVAGGC